MEITAIVTTTVFLSMIWFFVVLAVSKKLGVGKDAPFSRIMCCLIIMGPIGWSLILVIFAYDLVDKFSKKS